MLPAPSGPLVAGVTGAVVAAGFLGLGFLVVRALAGARPIERTLAWSLSLPGAVAFTLILTLVHIVSGGRVFASPWLVRGLTVAAALGLWLAVRRRQPAEEDRWDVRLALLLAGAGLLVWGLPVVRLLPLDFFGDTHWHAGWAAQMLNGEPLPSAAITGEIPNYYPWLFHAACAFLATFTPGGTTLHALAPLQMALVVGTVLILFRLGRSLTGLRATGGWLALFAGMSGGLGFVLLRYRDVVIWPRFEEGPTVAALRYGGDLLYRRSYHVAFSNLSPPLPRDVALAMLLGFLLLVAVGLRRRSVAALVGAGACLGMAGIAGAEAFLVGCAAAVGLTFVPVTLPRRTVALAVLGPAAALAAIWLVPLAIGYTRLGGFVNITGVEAIDLPPWSILVAWGITTPLAVVGVLRWRTLRGRPGGRVALAVVAGALFLLFAATLIPGAVGRAFLTLGRRHRYWPMLHLGVTMLASVGVTHLLGRIASRHRRLVASAIVVALAIPSAFVASISAPLAVPQPPAVAAALRGEPGTFVDALRGPTGARCTVAVPGRERQAIVWSLTGYRLVSADWKTRLPRNRARIRWRDLVPDDDARRRDNAALVTGDVDPQRWRDLVEGYAVDAILVEPQHASAPVFTGYPTTRTREGPVVVRTGSCDG
ncbi:MAG TPA: hypothetical protein VM638_06290 [Actinomycetota bacterium]|nr:hypothetical protein [Actinomycetota bacterium]